MEIKYLIIFELALITPWIIVNFFGKVTWEIFVCTLFYESALLYFYINHLFKH